MTPEVEQYSSEFLNRAADEFEGIRLPACERDQGHSGCSAIKKAIQDNLTTRDKSRAARIPVEELK